jgi:superfamily II DNA or RNA helicase
MSKIPYRLLCTATPAPNDFVELGTSSEALGGLTHSGMLETFFRQMSDDEKKKKATKSDIIHSKRLSWRVIQSIGQWCLKAHAFEPFWQWVSSWARACRNPSDLGPYDDSRFVLPPLNRHDHMVTPRTNPPGYLFTIPAFGLNQERAERRRTIPERTELTAELVNGNKTAIIWCQFNDEADSIAKAIPDAIEVKGSQSIDTKEELLQAFIHGEARVLVTKAKIAGLGLNMQHCAHVVTFVDHSYEKFYQSIRRCWRFGQKQPVRLDVICTEGELNVKRNMDRKQKLADQMFESIVAFMNESQQTMEETPVTNIEVPEWLST